MRLLSERSECFNFNRMEKNVFFVNLVITVEDTADLFEL